MLNITESLPEGLLDLSASDLHTLLPGPTLIHLQGQRTEPLFVSVLLHGNEHTGWEVIRKLLSEYNESNLPRSLSILIGNVEAARYNQRYLDQQPDYNRIWDDGDTSEHKMMLQVAAEMKQRNVFLSIDIHNNTGKNPHYACINNTYSQFLQLAILFSHTIVYFIRPKGVQSMAFAKFCPAVTIECGTSGEPDGIDHALQFVHTCLNLEKISEHAVSNRSFDLYHTVAIVKISQDISFGFDQGDYDLRFDKHIETSNFQELTEDTIIAHVKDGIDQVLDIRDEQGNDVYDQYFYIRNGELRTRRSIVPAMITVNTDVIRKDCFCYIMEHYPL